MYRTDMLGVKGVSTIGNSGNMYCNGIQEAVQSRGSIFSAHPNFKITNTVRYQMWSANIQVTTYSENLFRKPFFNFLEHINSVNEAVSLKCNVLKAAVRKKLIFVEKKNRFILLQTRKVPPLSQWWTARRHSRRRRCPEHSSIKGNKYA
jgi:hypothetical protein